MNESSPVSEYLVVSRGQWDKDASKEDIESAIQKFYDWYERNLFDQAGTSPLEAVQHDYPVDPKQLPKELAGVEWPPKS